MNKVKSITATTTVSAISIGQIIMDDSHYLTFWGQCLQENGQWLSCDFVTTYEVLNAMLRYSGHQLQDAVQMLIVQHLEEMRHVPDLIDLEAELGQRIVFSDMQFFLNQPHIIGKGNWNEYAKEPCFFIQKVVAMPVPPVSKPAASKLEACVQLLVKNYELYLGYIELELDETTARKEADLTDDLKFSMAYYAWQSK